MPDFRVELFKVDIGMFTILANLNLGHLTIDGDYESINRDLQDLVPDSSTAQVT